jgi:hypothetical protein
MTICEKKKRVETWGSLFGAIKKSNTEIHISGLNFTFDEIFSHPDLDELENKITDYLEQ